MIQYQRRFFVAESDWLMRFLALAIVLCMVLSDRVATGADDSELLFVDDFSKFKSDGTVKVEGNKLICSPGKGEFWNLFYPQRFGNVDLRVNVSCVSGEPTKGASALFWIANNNDHYKAEIFSDGLVQVARKTQGKWIYPVTGRIVPAAKKELGEVNELRVITSGDRAEIQVNGTQVVTFRGFPPAKESRIGLSAASDKEPFTWTFSDLTVRRGPVPEATPTKSVESLIFADDFSTLDAAWGSEEPLSVDDQKLILKPKVEAAYTRLYAGRFFDDGEVRVNLVQADGEGISPAGLVFWAKDLKNFHVVWIYSSGRARISAKVNGVFTKLVERTDWDAIKQGLGAVNQLKVVLAGRKATAYVNDQKLGEVELTDSPGPLQLGVSAESGEAINTFEFSNLEVRQLTNDALIAASDDFSKFDPAWGITSDTKFVEGGKLILKTTPTSGVRVYYGSDLWNDIDVRVKASQRQGTDKRSVGIVFWGSNDGFYAALAGSNGSCSVARFLPGGVLFPIQSQLRPAMVQGLNSENEYRVVTSGKMATVYVNGQEITSFQGFPPAGGGKVGLYGGPDSEWAFSNFSIRKTPEPQEPIKEADPTLLFAEDFATLDPSWGANAELQKVSENKLITTPKPNTDFNSLYSGALFNDADIRVTITLKKGMRRAEGGLIFWAADFKNYYIAKLNCNSNPDWKGGAISVGHRTEGKEEELFKEDAPELRSTTVLRVVTKGDSATIYVNDKPLKTITGTPPKGGGRIGLRAGSDRSSYIWTFSDLKVFKVSETP